MPSGPVCKRRDALGRVFAIRLALDITQFFQLLQVGITYVGKQCRPARGSSLCVRILGAWNVHVSIFRVCKMECILCIQPYANRDRVIAADKQCGRATGRINRKRFVHFDCFLRRRPSMHLIRCNVRMRNNVCLHTTRFLFKHRKCFFSIAQQNGIFIHLVQRCIVPIVHCHQIFGLLHVFTQRELDRTVGRCYVRGVSHAVLHLLIRDGIRVVLHVLLPVNKGFHVTVCGVFDIEIPGQFAALAIASGTPPGNAAGFGIVFVLKTVLLDCRRQCLMRFGLALLFQMPFSGLCVISENRHTRISKGFNIDLDFASCRINSLPRTNVAMITRHNVHARIPQAANELVDRRGDDARVYPAVLISVSAGLLNGHRAFPPQIPSIISHIRAFRVEGRVVGGLFAAGTLDGVICGQIEVERLTNPLPL